MSYKFKALKLKAKHQVYTLLSGQSLSKLKGEGYDFSELREYQIGDDIRKINWIITAKLRKPYIKELNANKELSIVLATLFDGGVYFAKDKQKQSMLTEVATLLGYASLHQNDLFMGIAYEEDKIYASPPTKQVYEIEKYSKHIFEASLLGTRLDYQRAIKDLFQRISKPSLLFVLGDFLEEIDLGLLAQKHEVIAIIIRHKEEENPKKLGEITLQNPHNRDKLESYFAKKSISSYLAKLQEHDNALIAKFSQQGIRYVKILTNEEPLIKLMNLFR